MAEPTAPISGRKLGKDKNLPGLLDQILSNFLKEHIDNCLPAVVVSFDQENNYVTVQPLIRLLQSDGTEVSRGTLTVPVFNYGTNKMSLRFNLEEGDLGWLEANDRDISLFLQSFKEERPNTLRKHSFSDAVFYPAAMKGMSFTADAIMSNQSGTVKTEWFNDKIVHTAETVDLVADNVNVSNDLNVGGDVNVDENVNVDGSIDAVGDIDSMGSITADDDIVAGADMICDNLEADTEVTAGTLVPATQVSLTGHTTTGVTPGAGVSGPPTPGT